MFRTAAPARATALGGHCERLWRHQSGGFLAPGAVATETAIEPPEEPMPEEMRVEPMPEGGKDDAPVVTRA